MTWHIVITTALSIVLSGLLWPQISVAELLLEPQTSGPLRPSQPLGTHFEITDHPLPDEIFPLELVFLGEPVDGLTRVEIEHAIERAAHAWNQVPCSRAELKWAGFRENLEDLEPGLMPVQFITGEEGFSELLAWTVRPPPGSGGGAMSVHLNHPRYRWSTQARPFEDPLTTARPTISIQSVLTHEFGHLLGLNHTFAHRAATMSPAYLRDGSQVELSADDKLGLCELYPQRGSECVDDADCPGRCVSSARGAVCDRAFGQVGEYCGFELQHCADYCHYDEPELGIGYCSTACADDTDCPENLRCGRPENFITTVCLFDPHDEPSATGCAATAPPHHAPVWLFATLLWLLFRRHRPKSHSTQYW